MSSTRSKGQLKDNRHGVLWGVRVLDITRVLAGPFCTMLLADLGADVIKVEAPGRGDDTRHWGPPWAGTCPEKLSAYFISVNRNKRSLTLNLKTKTGRELARQLAAQSQVLVENFRPGRTHRLGLSYEDLREINPGLVYCSITGFGQTGPYRDRAGYDYVIQAMSGLMSITGPSEGSPCKVGVAISDVIAGLFAVVAIMAALRHQERTGKGQFIDLSLLDTQIAALVNVASNYLVSGERPKCYGNQHPNIVPYQTFHAADGEFVLAVGNDQQFAQLCNLMERPDLLQDQRFKSNPARVENRETLIPLLQSIFARRSAREWLQDLRAAGIPAGPINDIPTILNDSHIQARELVQEVLHTSNERIRLVGPPVVFSETPTRVHRSPPLSGEHTEEVLKEVLGLDKETIAAHRTAGVL